MLNENQSHLTDILQPYNKIDTTVPDATIFYP